MTIHEEIKTAGDPLIIGSPDFFQKFSQDFSKIFKNHLTFSC